jgi:hypothetical protein
MSKAAPNIEPTPAVSGYDKMLFAIIERQLKSSSKRRAYVPPEQIARALRANAGIPLPPMIHDYLCNLLEGKIKAPAGRPSDTKAAAIKQIRKLLIPSTYERYLAWLRKRKRSKGLTDWAAIQRVDWWQGSPHERAARMTARALRYPVDWRTVLNIVSKAKK